MFCKDCGAAVDDGAVFCGNCGALMAAEAPLGAGPLPPPAGPATASPLSATPPAAYSPGWGPPQGPQPRGNRGLIFGIVAAVVIVLAGAGAGVYFGVFRGDGGTDATSSSTASSVAAGSTTTAGVTTSTSAGTTTTVAVSTTVQTIPSLTTTSGGPASTGTTVDPAEAYLTAQDAVVLDLQQDDERIPELATQINDTAPNVPKAVRDELQSMLDALDRDDMTLASLPRPEAFDQAFTWLQEAVMHMVNRVQATIGGIEAMWDTGRISSSTSYFDAGRAELSQRNAQPKRAVRPGRQKARAVRAQAAFLFLAQREPRAVAKVLFRAEPGDLHRGPVHLGKGRDDVAGQGSSANVSGLAAYGYGLHAICGFL